MLEYLAKILWGALTLVAAVNASQMIGILITGSDWLGVALDPVVGALFASWGIAWIGVKAKAKGSQEEKKEQGD